MFEVICHLSSEDCTLSSWCSSKLLQWLFQKYMAETPVKERWSLG